MKNVKNVPWDWNFGNYPSIWDEIVTLLLIKNHVIVNDSMQHISQLDAFLHETISFLDPFYNNSADITKDEWTFLNNAFSSCSGVNILINSCGHSRGKR